MEKQKEEEKRKGGTFAGSVLLENDTWDRDAVFEGLRKDWSIDLRGKLEANEDSIIAEYEGHMVVISLFHSPVPNQEATRNARNNYMWPKAEKMAQRHSAHIVVAVMQGDNNPIETGTLLAQIMATCCQQKGVIGVYTMGTVYEPNFYREVALSTNEGEFPLLDLVWFGAYKNAQGMSAYTYGLANFGKLEMEILNSQADPSEVLAFISSIAHYVITEDVTLNDGETVGLSGRDRRRITKSAGVALEGQETLKIAF